MLPIPPAAYWDNVPWWAYLLLIFVIAGFMPFMIKVIMGGQNFYQKREERALLNQQSLDTHREAFVLSLQADREFARNESRRERDLRLGAENELENMSKLARRWEDKSHELRHDIISVMTRFNALFEIVHKIIEGTMGIDRAKLLIAEVDRFNEPPRLKPFHEIERKEL